MSRWKWSRKELIATLSHSVPICTHLETSFSDTHGELNEVQRPVNRADSDNTSKMLLDSVFFHSSNDEIGFQPTPSLFNQSIKSANPRSSAFVNLLRHSLGQWSVLSSTRGDLEWPPPQLLSCLSFVLRLKGPSSKRSSRSSILGLGAYIRSPRYYILCLGGLLSSLRLCRPFICGRSLSSSPNRSFLFDLSGSVSLANIMIEQCLVSLTWPRTSETP